MVNHFASLLGNFSLTAQRLMQVPSVLGDAAEDPDLQISIDGELLISLDEYYMSLRYERVDNPLIWKDHVPLVLPRELANFGEILFPSNSSLYYKVFLLYSYLNIISATSFADEIYRYDSRITYNLADMQNYFRLQRNSKAVSSDSNFNLNLLGKFIASENMLYHLNNFVVKQVGNSSQLLVFSTTEGAYYNEDAIASPTPANMEVNLTLSTTPDTSRIIRVGATGLSFFISGPFNDSSLGFSTQSERFWAFTSETAPIFNFAKLMNTIESLPNAVEAMLNYRHNAADATYENIWKMHYNTAYRFVGLLLAYVNRINLLWLQQTSQ
jgi:hypothetical protein